jgi:hypothetical protein
MEAYNLQILLLPQDTGSLEQAPTTGGQLVSEPVFFRSGAAYLNFSFSSSLTLDFLFIAIPFILFA